MTTSWPSWTFAPTRTTRSAYFFKTFSSGIRPDCRLRSMAVLESGVQRDEVFERRRERLEGLVAELRERTEQVAHGGGEKATERHRSRGKLTARERIDRLVGPGAAVPELYGPAARGQYEGTG